MSFVYAVRVEVEIGGIRSKRIINVDISMSIYLIIKVSQRPDSEILLRIYEFNFRTPVF